MVSLLGSSLVQYAIMWYVTRETGSGVMFAIFIACSHFPTFFISPFGGVWADRYNRKHLAALADSGIAIATLALAVVFLLGYRQLWLLFVISAVRALGSGIHSPCISAFLPQFVPEDKLTRVNGIKSSVQSAMLLVSPALAGLLYSFAPLEYIFFIDVVTAAIAVPILLSIRLPAQQRSEVRAGGYFADLRQGFRYIRSHGYVRVLIVFFAAFYILVGPVAILTPLQVARSFGPEVWRLTAIELAFSGGMVAGGLVMTTWGGFKNRALSMAVAGASLGLLTVALGVVPDFVAYLAVMTVTGLMLPMFSVPNTVLLQERVEPDYLGRVFGVLEMLTSVAFPLSILVFGPLADSVRIEYLLMGTGALMTVEALLLTRSHTVMEAGKPKQQMPAGETGGS